MNLAYKVPYTVDDYMMWEGDWELINGDAISMAPSPYGRHQAVLFEIMYQMKNSFESCDNPCYLYYDTDYIIDELNVFRPDCSVVCKKVEKQINFTPLMIVEVQSDSTAIKDRTIKFSTYEKEGVKFYMMVDYKLRNIKLYELKDYRYVKILDDNSGKFSFDLNGCKIEFNIDKWWESM